MHGRNCEWKADDQVEFFMPEGGQEARDYQHESINEQFTGQQKPKKGRKGRQNSSDNQAQDEQRR